MLHLPANVRDETSEDYNCLDIIGDKHSQSQTIRWTNIKELKIKR